MGAAGDSMNGLHTNVAGQPPASVLVPSYSMYSGTPTYVANLKVRSNAPSFMAENELKLDILKRQHISQAQVRRLETPFMV